MKLLQLPTSRKLLQRILADPNLPDRVRSLTPSELARWIDQVGLEDCGEIVAFATTKQLQQVFDEDLWRQARPSVDEEFDPARFGIWLEILLELGPSEAARRITEMDLEFVTMAFSQLVWVVPFEDLQDGVQHEQGLEKLIESSLTYELEEFFLFARQPDSWDASVRVLVELHDSDHSLLSRILESCAYITLDSAAEEGGLSSVLSVEEELKSDVGYEREKRRESQGYVSPANARAFLKLAEGPLGAEDHVTPRQFHDVRRLGAHRSETGDTQKNAVSPSSHGHGFARVEAMLANAPSLREARMEELNYLANVLISGGSIKGRTPRPGEAAQIALKTCESGLEKQPNCRTLIEAFKAGWKKA